MPEYLSEAVAASPVRVKGKRWLVTIAQPGKGSSGAYTADMLKEYGPAAYPAKTKSYFGHAMPEERDPRNQMGTYPDGAFWNETEQKLQAELLPYPRWAPLVEEMGSDLELSMFALAYEKDDAGTITAIHPHRANSVDAVGYGGISGAGVQEQLFESLVEQARAAYDLEKPGSTPEQENGKNPKMDEKLDKLIALVETFITAQDAKKASDTQAEVNAEALAEAAKAAVDAYASRMALVEAARDSLLPSQVDDLMTAAKAGADVAPLVESAKKVYDEARSVLAETITDSGWTVTGSGKAEDWSVAGVHV